MFAGLHLGDGFHQAISHLLERLHELANLVVRMNLDFLRQVSGRNFHGRCFTTFSSGLEMEWVNIWANQYGQQERDDDGSDENIANVLVALLFPVVFLSNLIQLKHDRARRYSRQRVHREAEFFLPEGGALRRFFVPLER